MSENLSLTLWALYTIFSKCCLQNYQSIYTVERQRSYTKESPIIAQIEEMIAKGDVDSLIFGEKNVKESYTEFRLKYLITSDDDLYELYKEKDETTVCTVVFSTKLEQYGLNLYDPCHLMVYKIKGIN